MSAAGAAAEAAISILGELVKKWVAEGKDPRVEARRLVSGQAAKARGEAAAAAVVASKPKAKR